MPFLVLVALAALIVGVIALLRAADLHVRVRDAEDSIRRLDSQVDALREELRSAAPLTGERATSQPAPAPVPRPAPAFAPPASASAVPASADKSAGKPAPPPALTETVKPMRAWE